MDRITLKAARVNARLKQSDVEQRLGLPRSTLTRWETGKNIPRADTMIKLCDLYGVSVKEIDLRKR